MQKKMNEFIKVTEGIYRLKVPFEAIYTSVFLITLSSGNLLVDCATTEKDVDEYIVPALKKTGQSLSDMGALILTHRHSDHAGGLERILTLAPNMKVITGEHAICDCICTYPMAGHTEDCIGVLDMRSHTLISGDGLQGAGVDKYRCYTKLPAAYLETIERIKNDGRIENILFSHAYEPWNKDCVKGRHAVDECLFACIKYVNGGKNESNTDQ